MTRSDGCANRRPPVSFKALIRRGSRLAVMRANNDSLGVRSASVSGSDAEGRPLEVRQSARPTFFIWSLCDSGHSFSEVSRGTKEFHVDKITRVTDQQKSAAFILSRCRNWGRAQAGCTLGVASTK